MKAKIKLTWKKLIGICLALLGIGTFSACMYGVIEGPVMYGMPPMYGVEEPEEENHSASMIFDTAFFEENKPSI